MSPVIPVVTNAARKIRVRNSWAIPGVNGGRRPQASTSL